MNSDKVSQVASLNILNKVKNLHTHIYNKSLTVYVATNSFQENAPKFIKVLPPKCLDFCLDCGICHFFILFKTIDGRIFQFDFGPKGKEVHFGNFSLNVANMNVSPNQMQYKNRTTKKSVPGEIREKQLKDLPNTLMYIGESNMTLNDIRDFNLDLPTDYLLNKNDCRHYVNNMVHFTTGVNSASTQYLKNRFRQKKSQISFWNNMTLRIFQTFTAVDNWQNIKTIGQATMAALIALTIPYLTKIATSPITSKYLPNYSSTKLKLLNNKKVTSLITKPCRRALMAAAVTTAMSSENDGPIYFNKFSCFGNLIIKSSNLAMNIVCGLRAHMVNIRNSTEAICARRPLCLGTLSKISYKSMIVRKSHRMKYPCQLIKLPLNSIWNYSQRNL